jgi:hypothetical protein
MPRFDPAQAGDTSEGITQTQAGVPGLQEGFQRGIAASAEDMREQLAAKKKFEKIDNDTWLLDIVNAYRREARQLYGQEFTKSGKDTIGGVDRARESFNKFSADIRAKAPNEQYANLANQQISGIFNPYQDKLSAHGLAQMEVGMLDGIDREVDSIAEEVFVSGGTPEALEAGIMQANLQMDLYEENYGKGKADAKREEVLNTVAIEALKRQIQSDPAGTAEAITRGDYNEFINTETRDDLLSLASGQAKINETRAKKEEAARVEQVNQELFDSFANETLTLPQVVAVDIPSKNKTFWEGKLKAQAKKPSRFEKSRPETYATMVSRVYLSPNTVTEQELADLMGAPGDDWLSTNNAKELIKVLQKEKSGEGDTTREAQIKEVLKSYNRNRIEGQFGKIAEPSTEVEYNRQVSEFITWANNPENQDQNPVDFYNESMKVRKFAWYEGAFTGFDSEVERRQENRIIRAGGVPWEEWLTNQKKVPENQDLSDEELREIYLSREGR